jgi:hypothetical protein
MTGAGAPGRSPSRMREEPPYPAVNRLTELDPAVHAWVATHRAPEQAGRLVPTFDPTASRDPVVLSVSEAVRVLNGTGIV